MRVEVDGKTISLTQKNFLAQGGEGAIYVQGRTAYKVYTDPKRMIPVGKIKELSALDDPKIIKPNKIIYNNGKPVGYTMRYVTKAHHLCQVFTKSFKSRHNITPDMALDLVRGMQNTVISIHGANVLIVDLNEMNFLVDKKFSEVFFIDVDSYQTPSYPATALMESVRDRHNKTFSEGTDWFSFAVVSFQILIGIHPYKGKHPKLKGIDSRMQANVSVFDKDVRMPKTCPPLDIIPPAYYDWYIEVLENGVREAPPIDMSKSVAIAAVVQTITGSNNFAITELFKCKWDIYNVITFGQSECVVGGGGACCDRRSYIDRAWFKKYNIPHPDIYIGHFGSAPICAWVENDLVRFVNLKTRRELTSTPMAAEQVMVDNGRIFVKSGERIILYRFFGSEMAPTVAPMVVGNAMTSSTKMFPGVVINQMLGTYKALTFRDDNGCLTYDLKELQEHKIIDAKHNSGILMVVGYKNGQYDRFVYNLDTDKVRKVEDVAYAGINFVVKDNEVCVSITEQECVEIFSKNDIMKTKVIDDPKIHSGMRLFTDGATIFFVDGPKLYKLEMK